MQSCLCGVSISSANYHLSWPQRHRIPIIRTAKNLHSKSPYKPLIISNSLKTSFNSHKDFHFREENFKNPENGEEEEENQFGVSYRLPIVVRNSSSVLRYFWDRNQLKLVALDGNSFSLWDFCSDFDDGFRKLVRICASALRNFFLPREVSPNYLEYVKWKFLHRVSSSALQVLATQAMFRAIGIGFSRSLPSAAALNWVLKDGLGRLSRCIYTASLASAFDTNLK